MPAFWGVVRSQPMRERFASEQLNLRGYETFLPLIQTKRSTTPLFASYFFVLIVYAMADHQHVFRRAQSGPCWRLPFENARP